MNKLKLPIIIFTKNDKKIGSMDKLIADLTRISAKNEWNSNIEVVDSNGNLFFVKTFKQSSNILFWQSIKNLGKMVEITPVFEKESTVINLENLKLRIKNHLDKNNSFWSNLDDGSGFNNMVNSCNTFEKLIKMFR